MIGWFSTTFCTSYYSNQYYGDNGHIENEMWKLLEYWFQLASIVYCVIYEWRNVYLAIDSPFGPRCTRTQCCQQNEHKTLANWLHRCLSHFRSLGIWLLFARNLKIEGNENYYHLLWKWMILGAMNDYATPRRMRKVINRYKWWKIRMKPSKSIILFLLLAMLRVGQSHSDEWRKRWREGEKDGAKKAQLHTWFRNAVVTP